MQFLADVELICEECKGTRYKPQVLEVRYRGKNIHEVLNLMCATFPQLLDRVDLHLLIPLGATEQHGPHLPLNTDTVIASGVGEAVAASPR